MSEKQNRFPTRTYLAVLAVIGLVALAPLFSVLISSAIANSAGCPLDEGGSHPCTIGGKDWGDALNTMFVLGWFMLLTIPLGVIAMAGWLVTIIIHRSRWKTASLAAPAIPPKPPPSPL